MPWTQEPPKETLFDASDRKWFKELMTEEEQREHLRSGLSKGLDRAAGTTSNMATSLLAGFIADVLIRLYAKGIFSLAEVEELAATHCKTGKHG